MCAQLCRCPDQLCQNCLEVEHFQKVVDAAVVMFAIKVCTEVVFSC